MAKIDIKKVAQLANLPLTREEEQLYQKQLDEILTYVDQIENKVKNLNINPVFNVSEKLNVLSSDKVEESLSSEDAVKNSPNSQNGSFVTKGVFTEE
jgi:aspartyl-tRNA(Asn)/glutamyl-tRNA(Gln) amidotransferase subunit C